MLNGNGGQGFIGKAMSPHCPPGGGYALGAKMRFNLPHRIAKGRVGLFHSHAIQDKSDGRHIEALQGIHGGEDLGARGDAGLDDDDDAIDKAGKILSFRGDSEGRGIGEHEALLAQCGFIGYLLHEGSGAAAELGGGLVRCAVETVQRRIQARGGRGSSGSVHEHRRAAHGLQDVFHASGHRGDTASSGGAGEDAGFEAALLTGMLDGGGEAQELLGGHLVRDLVEIGQDGHGSEAEHMFYIGSDVDLGIEMIGERGGEQTEDQPTQGQGQGFLEDSRPGGMERGRRGDRQMHTAGDAILEHQIVQLFIHAGVTRTQSHDVRFQVADPLQLGCGAGSSSGEDAQLAVQAGFNSRSADQIGAQLLLDVTGGSGAQVLHHGIETGVDLGQLGRVLLVRGVIGRLVCHLGNENGATRVERSLHAGQSGIGGDQVVSLGIDGRGGGSVSGLHGSELGLGLVVIGLSLDELLACPANIVVDEVGSRGTHRSHAQLFVQVSLLGVVGVEFLLNAIALFAEDGDALFIAGISLARRSLDNAGGYGVGDARGQHRVRGLGGNCDFVAGADAGHRDGAAEPLDRGLFALVTQLECAGAELVERAQKYVGTGSALHLLLDIGVVGSGFAGPALLTALGHNLGLDGLNINLTLRNIDRPGHGHIGDGQQETGGGNSDCQVAMQFKSAQQIEAEEEVVFAAGSVGGRHRGWRASHAFTGPDWGQGSGLSPLQVHNAPAKKAMEAMVTRGLRRSST